MNNHVLGEEALLFRQKSPCFGTDGQLSFFKLGNVGPLIGEF